MPRSITRLVADTVAIAVLASCGGGSGSADAGSTGETLSITAASPPVGTSGLAYPGYTFTARGGTPPIKWTESGPVPSGLRLSASGQLSGTPVTAGTYPFSITGTDSSMPPLTARAQVSLKINDTPIVVAASPSPPAGMVSTSYPAFGFSASGGSPPYAWSASGTLPPGLMFGKDGTVSGTPTSAGTFSFSVTATDSAQTPVSGPPLATQILITNPQLTGISGTYRSTAFGLSGDSGAEITINFDGTGHVSGSQVENNGGKISTTAITGTYSLAANNTLTVTPVGSGTFVGAVSQDRVIFVADSELDLGLVPAIQVGVREGSADFTDQSLNGSYQLVSYGNSGNSAARWTLSFNGAGHFAGSEVINNAGAISTRAVAGTYAVAADGKLMLTPSGGSTLTGGVSTGGDALVAEQITSAQLPSLQVGIRAGPGTYSDATVSGLYELATWGTSGGSRGFLSFDGAGHYSGGFRSVGTYSVAGDGTLTLSATAGAALTGRVSASGDMLIASQTTAGQLPTVKVGAQISSVSLGPTLVFTCVVASLTRCTPWQDTYLVNNGATPVSVRVVFPLGPPFLETNDCPSSLGPRESCAIRLSVQSVPAPGTYLLRVYDSSSPVVHTVAVTVTVY